MVVKRVRVFGAGPAGTSFSIAILSSLNLESLEIYEGDCPYRKPCGEALLNQDMEIYDIEPPIIEEVKDFYIKMNGMLLAERHYSKALWFIIDKEEWISSLRNEAIRLGGKLKCVRSRIYTEKGFITVDSRGPFTDNKKRKIPIARAIIEGEVDFDGVVMDFDPENIGFYWIFPAKRNTLNAGYGSLLSRKPTNPLLEYLKRNIRNLKIKEISTSVITLDYPSPNKKEEIYKIGEASGTVFPLTGEGIRPSVYHSKEFAKKISEELVPEEAYMASFKEDKMGKIVRQMKLQSMILKTLLRIPPSVRRSAIRLLPSFLDRYLGKGEIPFP